MDTRPIFFPKFARYGNAMAANVDVDAHWFPGSKLPRVGDCPMASHGPVVVGKPSSVVSIFPAMTILKSTAFR